ncbi:MAG: hypothetical protein ABSE70_09080 [Candidatus Limnocylindrales bacterium]
MDRKPHIVGDSIDKVLGFVAGFFASWIGVVATVVVMYLWAGRGQPLEVRERRRHAASVSIWSGIGFLALLVLVILLIVTILRGLDSFG